MPRSRKILRWAITAAFVITLLPVINLNVERLAEQRGWDQILSQRWDTVISIMASIATNPWFLVFLGTAFGGTLFMWIDYFLRRIEATSFAQSASSSTTDPTPEQLDELLSHIERTKKILIEADEIVTYEGFHEVSALMFKLIKYDIPMPMISSLKDEIKYEIFNKKYYRYLATIAPHIRHGDIQQIRSFAEFAVVRFGKAGDESVNRDASHESPSPQEPESGKQP